MTRRKIEVGDLVCYESDTDIGRVTEVFGEGEWISVSFAPGDVLICEPISEFRAAGKLDAEDE